MAKAIDAYAKELTDIEAAIKPLAEDFKRSQALRGQTFGVITEGEKEIALRVHELRAKAVFGTKLADFMSDSEVKTMAAEVDRQVARLTAELNKNIEQKKGPIAMINARLKALEADLKADIAKRKGAVSTMLGSGNASLPDLVKLQAKVAEVIGSSEMSSLNEMILPIDQKKASAERIAKLMAQSGAAVKEDARDDKDLQALNVRVMKGNVDAAKTHYAKVGAEIAKAKKAMAGKKTSELAAAKVAMNKAFKELEEIVEPYERVNKDSFVMGKVETSPDKDKIKGWLKELLEMQTKAAKDIKALASAK